MKGSMLRRGALAALLACGGFAREARAFSLFGPSREVKIERALKEIQDLVKKADDAALLLEDFEAALKLYQEAIEKTRAFEKNFSREEDSDARFKAEWARNNCEMQQYQIAHLLATRMNEKPIAVTPAPPEAAAPPPAGAEVPSRRLDDAAPAATPAAVPPPARDTAPAAAALPALSIGEALRWARDQIRMERHERAEATLAEVIRADPSNPDARFLLALVNFQAGRNDVAEMCLGDLLEDAPSEAAWLLLGAVRHQSGDIPGAIEALDHALKANPASALAYYNLAQALPDVSDDPPILATARAYYQRALELGAAGDAALEAKLNGK